MSSKTALQELIEWIKTIERLKYDTGLINKAQSLLPKEKEDIMNAFDSGCELGIGYENAEDYFTNTFNQ